MNKKTQEKFLYKPSDKLPDSLNLWFCFPAPYNFGMSALGYLALYSIFDKNPLVNPERVFSDTEKTNQKFQDVDLMGFSFSFEFDFINIFRMLDKYAIPFYSADRSEEAPLIFAGGPVMSANPEPFCCFFDFIMIGDGEDSSNEIIDVLNKNKGASKSEKLRLLSEIEGIYVPSLYSVKYNDDFSIKEISPNNKIIKRTKKQLDCVSSPIVTENTMFSDNCLIEVARGCPNKCAFCLASYSNLPYRWPSCQQILDAIDLGIKNASKIGLLGALVAAHPDFDKICAYVLKKLEEEHFEVSISSLRADKITPETVKMLVKGGQRSSTIALEAGSQRLRDFINKRLTEEQVFESIQVAADNGLSALKIYSMIGLPDETMDDIEELCEFMRKLKEEFRNMSFTLSSSSFVPKANTPFQWYGRESLKILKSKNEYLKKHLHIAGIKYRPTSIKWDNIQGLLSRGDRRLSPVLLEFYNYSATLGSINRAYKKCLEKNSDLPCFEWYTNRNISKSEILPWDFIQQEYSKKNLLSELERLESKAYISSGI